MTDPAPFIGNRIRTSEALADWHAAAEPEVAIEPEMAIIDAHHHLYGDAADTHHYLLDELNADIDAGHRIVGTVYCSGLISSDKSIGGQSGIDEEKEQDDKNAPTI